MSHSLTVRRYTKKAGRQVTQTGQRDILHHGILCPVYKLGELLRKGNDQGSGMGSDIGQQVMSNCIVHNLVFPGFYFF